VPAQWWPEVESANAVIDSEGPWPSLSPRSNGRFVALDVDRHEGVAIVVGFGPNRHGRHVLGSDEFKRTEPGQWDYVSGSGISHDLDKRTTLTVDGQTLHLCMSGKSGWSPLEPRARIESAVFLCGPDVGSVEIRRRGGVRIADLRTGPGWLGVVWAEGDPPEVVAFTAQGSQTFSWSPPGKAA
jgi:hypothetical protein